MDTLAQSITGKSVVAALVRFRMKLARHRHDSHFLRNLVASAPDPAQVTHALDGLFPARKHWQRPGRAVRRIVPDDDHYRMALYNATIHGLQGNRPELWVRNLKDLIAAVSARARDPQSQPLQAPVIRILPKGMRDPKGKTEYRIVSVYEDLADRLILSFAAKYLGRHVDPLLLDCSCAFRLSACASRKLAVSRIADYLKARSGRKVYAAECDVKGFFDCVRHDVARQAMRRTLHELAQAGVTVDPAAVAIIEQYLNGYDYFAYAKPAALRLLETRKKGKLGGVEMKELLELNPKKAPMRIGIPQGGALSPLLANLILHDVDKAVLGDEPDPDLLYFRYCDDMILLHPNKQRCGAALARYMTKVKELGFVVHKPEAIRIYGARFFSTKSKLPYRVAPAWTSKSASPWVSFLGYQIGWDGQLRVRKESLEKHKDQQATFVKRLVAYLAEWRAKPLKSNDAIVSAVAWRLVASGIGKSGLKGTGASGGRRCWRKAFELLDASPAATAQMRKLDQHRDRLISGLMATLHKKHPANYDKRRMDYAKANGVELSPKRPLIGRALSYCGSLIGDVPRRLHTLRPTDAGYGKYY